MSTPHTQPANWYPDPSGAQFLRYWDGAAWTGHTRPAPHAVAPNPPAGHSLPRALTPAGSPVAAPMVLYPQQVPAPTPIGVWRGPADSRPLVSNLFDAVSVCIQKYAHFDGRAGRPEFWYAQLAVPIVVFASLIMALVPVVGWGMLVLLWLFSLGSFVPLLAVTVRRLRDAGFHWAWFLLAFAPFGGIAVLVMCAQPSKHP